LLKFCIIITLILSSSAAINADEVFSKNKKANDLYKQGNYKEALKLYEDAQLLSPSDSKLKMNQGSAHYKLGDYAKADELYSGALSTDDKKVLADAHYNLGNILYKQAEKIQQSGGQDVQEKYKNALQNYIKSLEINPDNLDAKWNLQLAHQRIKQLEQQQQQQNKDNKDNKDQKNDQNDQKKNDQDKNQDQKKEDQEQKDQEKKQDQQKEQQDKKEEQQQSEMKESKDQKEMDKEDARRLIELYADDADSLNKPQKKPGKTKQPEQDW
jgi:tetratricopeptide (TPR) repeat protein